MLRRGVLFLVVAACAALSLPSVAAEADAKVQLKLSVDGKEKGHAKDLHTVVEAIAERLQLLTDAGSKYDLSLGSQGEEVLEEAVIKAWEDIKKGGSGSVSGSGSEGDETEVGDDEDIEEIPSTEDEEGDGEEEEPVKEEVKKSRKHVAKKHAAKKHAKKHSKKHGKGWWDSAASKIDDVLHSVASKASDVADTIGEHVSNAVNKTGEALEDAFGSGSDDEEDEDSESEEEERKKAKKVVKKAKKSAKKSAKKDAKKTAKKHAKKDKNGKGILDTIHHAWDSVASKADDLVDHIASKADDLADHVFGSDSDEDEVKVKSINLAQKDQGGMSMQTIAAIGSVVGALVGVIVVAMVIVVNRRNAGHGEMSPDPVVDEDAAEVESTETTHLDENKADETEGKFEGTV